MTWPPSFVQMSTLKNITRFHHQDAIYLPRPQALAMVLGVFNLNIKKSETKEETKREEKNNNVLPSHYPLLLLVPITLHSGPRLRYWRETVSLLDAM